MPPTFATTEDLRDLYLDLVKRSLTGALAEDNDSILGGVRMQGATSLKKRAANAVAKVANRFDLEIAYKKPYDPAAREAGQDWPARAESMIGLKRMWPSLISRLGGMGCRKCGVSRMPPSEAASAPSSSIIGDVR